MSEAPRAIPQPGDRAPAFRLQSVHGGEVRLSALKGRRVILYFYPKDDTEGCTLEAKEFQSHLDDFKRMRVTVLGISPDSLETHRKFASKHGLSFPLLSDPDHAVADKYGVWVEKQMYGRRYWGVQRATFVVGPSGRVERVWPKVRPKGHAAAVIEWFRNPSAT